MYLMDHIVELAQLVRERRNVNHPVVGVFPAMEEKLKGCPRFLFSNDAIHTAVELTLGRPKILREAMANLRIPYPKMWIEWDEDGREKLRQTFGPQDDLIDKFRPLPKRIGFYLESHNGRAGMVYWAWNNTPAEFKELDSPNICPISAFFDLDNNYPVANERERNFLKANLAGLWKDNAIQTEALKSIWHTSMHAPNDWGLKYLNYIKAKDLSIYGRRTYEAQLSGFYADVYGEYIMIWAVLMLLTSSKKIVDYTKIDNTKWNKARVKQRKAPKLDHTVVTIHINKEIEVHQKGMPLGYTRKSPRIHMVSSYLGRRGDKHWVVQPFWRGKGEMISRHVHVKP